MELSKPTRDIYLDIRNPSKNKGFPLKLRITFERETRYFSLRKFATAEDWEKINNKNTRDKVLKAIRTDLEMILAEADDVFEKLTVFTFEAFKILMFGEKKSSIAVKDDVYTLFEEKIAEKLKANNYGGSLPYSWTMKSMKNFRSKIEISEINVQLLDEYQEHLKKRGNNNTTIAIYLKQFRAICNLAIKKKLLSQDNYPFKGYKIPASRNIKKSLSFDDIKAILNYKCDNPRQGKMKARDFWVFSYLTNGLNFADIAYLKDDNIADDFTQFIRKKTEWKNNPKPIRAFLDKEAKAIIERQGTLNRKKGDYIFPILTQGLDSKQQKKRIQSFVRNNNKYMVKVAEELGIDKVLSTYSARHSFGTVLKRKGVGTSLIKDSFGHSSERVTESYLDSHMDETIQNTSSFLTDL